MKNELITAENYDEIIKNLLNGDRETFFNLTPNEYECKLIQHSTLQKSALEKYNHMAFVINDIFNKCIFEPIDATTGVIFDIKLLTAIYRIFYKTITDALEKVKILYSGNTQFPTNGIEIFKSLYGFPTKYNKKRECLNLHQICCKINIDFETAERAKFACKNQALYTKLSFLTDLSFIDFKSLEELNTNEKSNFFSVFYYMKVNNLTLQDTLITQKFTNPLKNISKRLYENPQNEFLYNYVVLNLSLDLFSDFISHNILTKLEQHSIRKVGDLINIHKTNLLKIITENEFSKLTLLLKHLKVNLKKKNPDLPPTAIENLNFSTKVYFALKRANIHSISQLESYSDDDFSQIKRIGPKALKEIHQKLNSFNEKN